MIQFWRKAQAEKILPSTFPVGLRSLTAQRL